MSPTLASIVRVSGVFSEHRRSPENSSAVSTLTGAAPKYSTAKRIDELTELGQRCTFGAKGLVPGSRLMKKEFTIRSECKELLLPKQTCADLAKQMRRRTG